MCALRRTVHAGGDRPDPLRQVPGAHAPGAGLAAAAGGDRRLHASARAGRGPLLALLAGRGRAGAGGGAQALAPLRARPERGAALPRRGAAPRRGARAGPSQPGAADHRGRAPRLRLLPRLPDRRRADARRRAALTRPRAAGPRARALRAALREPRGGARAGGLPSRPEAGQRRPHQGGGRHRAGGGARPRHRAPARESGDPRTGAAAAVERRVFLAGAGRGQPARRPQRSLLCRRAALPARLGPPAADGRDRRRVAQGAPRSAGAAAARRGPQDARRPRGAARVPARQGPRAPVRQRRRGGGDDARHHPHRGHGPDGGRVLRFRRPGAGGRGAPARA